MARARNLKPSFFTNDKLAELDPLGRLLFAGLWTIADREGRLEDRPKRIKAEILPYDDADADKLLDDLASGGFILRYAVESQRCVQILAFSKHQDPHYKEKPSALPAPPNHEDSGKTAGGVDERVRQAVFDRDSRKCVACGSTDDLSLDHIVPRSAGGSHDESNLQTLCRRCNSGKNNRIARSMIGRPLTNDRPTSAVQPPTLPPLIPDSPIPLPDSKKVKNKPSAPATPLPGWLAAEDWERWRKHRGRKAEGEAGRLQIAKLDALRQQGHDPPAMISAAIESGWATFYPPRAPPMAINGSAAQGRAEVADFIFKRGKHGSGEQKPGAERDITGESERVA